MTVLKRWTSFVIGFVIMLTSLFFVSQNVQAGIVSNFSVTASRQQTSTTTDHVLRFVTPTGVDASTDTIKLVYESGYDLSSLSSPLDFDFAVDDDASCDGPFTDQTLAAAPAAGVWGVGIAAQEITFTAPTDAAGGEIAASRCVQIEIGLSASAGGAGVNQITNPGSTGDFEVGLTGTFGDSGQAAVSIISDDTVSITAGVGDSGGGGCSGPGCSCGDVISPLIVPNIVNVTNITGTSATISWDTNENTDELIHWDTISPPFPQGQSHYDGALQSSHSYTITGLNPGTQYFVRVRSEDLCDNGVQDTVSFTTIDTTPFIITPTVINITQTTATVIWDTDRLADSLVDYGLTPLFEIGTVSDGTFVLFHSLDLSSLTPDTTYEVRAQSIDQFANIAVGTTTFTTLPDPPPANPTLSSTTDCLFFELTWTNPSDPDLAGVRLVRKEDSPPLNPNDGVVVFDGLATSYIDSSITEGQEYYYALFAYDTQGNFSSGVITNGEANCPTPISLFIFNEQAQNITTNSATIFWETNLAADSRLRWGINPNLTAGPLFDPAFVTDRSFNITNLTPDTLYLVEVHSETLTLADTEVFTFRTLPEDTIGPFCGDGICEDPENPLNCPIDCSDPDPEPPTDPGCGDGICEDPENPNNCPIDCPALPPPTIGIPPVTFGPVFETGIQTGQGLVTLFTITNLALLTLFFNLFPYLRFFFTQPFLLYFKRRKKEWGVVYNAVTKLPIDLAIVRLYRAEDGKLIRTRVTEQAGRYAFQAKPGKYTLAVTKAGYEFPSVFMKGDKYDGKYVDLYHGGEIEVKEDEELITPNIPIDHLTKDKETTPARVQFKEWLESFSRLVSMATILLALFIVIVQPTLFNFILLGVQILVYLLFWRLTRRVKPKAWGAVVDKETGKPLANAIVRIFEPTYNKLLATRVTNNAGRYFFLLGPNTYYATIERKGYKTVAIDPIDFTDNKQPEEFSDKVEMEKE